MSSPVPYSPSGTASARRQFLPQAWLIAGGYAVFAALWIYTSDHLLRVLLDDPEMLVRWSVYKGIVFVGVTALLLLVALRRALGAADRGYEELRRNEEALARSQRLYAALGQINQSIVRLGTREELFQRVCDALVEQGKFHMAWIGWEDPATRRLVPLAEAGNENDYVRTLSIYTDDRPEGRGPMGRSFRSGVPYVCNDLLNDSATQPWRAEIKRRGFQATAVFPIRVGDRVCGLLNVYSDEPGFFQELEFSLISSAAADLSFALDHLAREQARREAERAADSERLFSDAIIESMPGILYFYDERGRFLRWNRNFEDVSGYSREEIARMSPLDFFLPEDRADLAARIAEVMTEGDSVVEAPFLAKDGSTLPYFFTGRRVIFEGQACLVGVGIDISERKRTELALIKSEQRYRSTLDTILEGCQLISFDWRYLYLNAAAEIQNRRPNQELLGRNMRETWPGIEQTGLFALLRRSLEERIALYEETEFTFADGSQGWFDLRVQPVPEGILVLSIDITERRRAEQALRDSETRLRRLFEQAPFGIFVVDNEHHILAANLAGGEMLGYAPRELTGMQVTALLETAEHDRLDVELPLLAEGRAHVAEWRQVRRDGSTFPAEVSARRLNDQSYLAIMQDLTERKEAERIRAEFTASLERKVEERTNELQAALVRAEAADRIKSAFLATMSHELRTPLNSIIGFTGIVLQGLAGPLNAEQSKQLGMVRGSARHLLELINDVLDISKIEAGQLEVRAEPFDLAASIDRAIATVRPLAERKGLDLVAHVPVGLGQMTGDRRRVEQILLNLLNNALKFTEQGRVTLTVTMGASLPTLAEYGDQPAVRIDVADTGIGIKPEHLTALFQPFRQIDSGLSRQHDGTGLGLVICRRLAALMGGEISVTSEWSKGSVFTVILPLHSQR